MSGGLCLSSSTDHSVPKTVNNTEGTQSIVAEWISTLFSSLNYLLKVTYIFIKLIFLKNIKYLISICLHLYIYSKIYSFSLIINIVGPCIIYYIFANLKYVLNILKSVIKIYNVWQVWWYLKWNEMQMHY